MKTRLPLIFLCTTAVLASGCRSSDTRYTFSINEALVSPQAQEVLDPSIQVQFATGGGTVVMSDLVSNKKTNAFGKAPQEACNWAFLSAVKQFQDRAKAEGATRVVNLISYYKKVPYSSTTDYECHFGNVVAGVALKGDLAR